MTAVGGHEQAREPSRREESTAAFRLTALAHGGGCGCKLAPSVLQDILKGAPLGAFVPDLLVGSETADDAAVYRLNDSQAVIATTDFFMPIVDDPYDFGRIAATNALSDVYAMGGRPIFALAVLGMPVGKIAIDVVRRIAAGGASVCESAGIAVAGGHSIDSAEPIYGLVAIGVAHPDHILRNGGARAGDALILTKGLGIGIYSAALRRDELDAESYAAMVGSATQLNRIGAELPEFEGVHAATDVTGFGLLGHALEMAQASGLGIALHGGAIPFLPRVEDMARRGIRTGASPRNWASYGPNIVLEQNMEDWRRDLLCDPQTSGGLLIAVAKERAPALLRRVRDEGFARAAIVGEVREGPPSVTVTAPRA